jgi:formate dehydrogenase subunit delta
METASDDAARHGAPENLVYMANQIARFFSSQGSQAAAAEQTAEHIRAFWAPSMRRRILALVDAHGAGDLSVIARAGVELLRR